MNSKKDILFLCQFFYPDYISSATLPFDTALALSNEGFTVDVLCGYPNEYNISGKVANKERYENINIKRLKYLQLKRTNFLGRIINYFSFTFAVLLRIFSFSKYKTVIVYSNPPILPIVPFLAKLMFKLKFVFVCYDVYPEIANITGVLSENGVINKIMIIINRLIFKSITKIVVLSNEMKEYLLKNRDGLNSFQIEVIPNWYEDKKKDLTDFKIVNEEFKKIRTEYKIIVSYFGNMGVCQDMDTIISAIDLMKTNNEILFLFAGHGNKMQLLKDTVKSQKLNNVKIFDFLHGQDFQDALDISDCFISSLADGLTGLCVPSKTYSYMMAGKPIISIISENSDIARELHEYNAGFVVKSGDIYGFKNCIEKLYNEEERKIMGENCRKLFLEKYTMEQCTKKYVNMMKKLLGD